MNIITRIKNGVKGFRSSTLANPSSTLLDYFGGGETYTGKKISATSALQISAVWSSVQVIASDMAKLPFSIYKKTDTGRVSIPDHNLTNALSHFPNSEMSAIDFTSTMMLHLLLRGNAYAQIIRSNDQKVLELYPISPDNVVVKRVDGELMYVINTGSKIVSLPSKDVFHLRGALSQDGVTGLSVISYGKQSMGFAAGIEEYGARLFGNSCKIGNTFSSEVNLSKEAYANFITEMKKIHEGSSNAHRDIILPVGITKQPAAYVAPNDAQFLETRKFTIEEIGRLFRVPPHKISSMEHSTFSNIEHQSLEFVQDCLLTWIIKWEQQIYRSLLSDEEKKQGFYGKYNVNAILRGDVKTRTDHYRTMFNLGVYSINEIRKFEEKNPITEDYGDKRFIQLNMSTVDNIANPVESAVRSENPDQETRSINETRSFTARLRLRKRYKPIIKNEMTRIINKEVAELSAGLEKHLTRRGKTDYKGFIKTFYKTHKAFIVKTLGPVISSYAGAVAEEAADEVNGEPPSQEELDVMTAQYIDDIATERVSTGEGQLLALLDDPENAENLDEVINERLDGWGETEAEKLAQRNATEGEARISRLVWVVLGWTGFRWVTHGDNCPICETLSGKIVGVNGSFTSGNIPNGKGGTFKTYGKDILQPPLHGGCACSLSPTRL